MKKFVFAIIGLFVVVTIAFVIALMTINPTQIINSHKDELAQQVSQKLGRKLSLGQVQGHLFPILGASISDVRLQKIPTEKASESQIAFAKLSVRIQLLPALLSLGKDLRVDALELKGLKVSLSRDQEGRWDFQDILDKIDADKMQNEPAAQNEKPKDLTFLQGAKISKIRIIDGQININDASLGRPLGVEKINMSLDNIALGQALKMTLAAEFVDGKQHSPIQFNASIPMLPKDLSFDPVPDIKAELSVDKFAIAPWAALLPADSLKAKAGKLDVQLRTELANNLQNFSAKGFVQATGLQLQQKGKSGQTANLHIDVKADIDKALGRYKIEQLDAVMAGLTLKTRLDATALNASGLKNADISLKIKNLKTLLAVLPDGNDLLPPELTLEGPVDAKLRGNSSAANLTLDLDQALLLWSDSFSKKAGRALHLKMTAKKQGQKVKIPNFELAIDDATIRGKLNIGLGDKGAIEGQLDSGILHIASLKNLLPPIEKALAKGERVDGDFVLKASASMRDGQQQADASLSLQQVKIKLASLIANGSGQISAKLDPSLSGSRYQLKAQLDQLGFKSLGDDGKTVLDKPAGMPMSLLVDLDKSEKEAQVHQANLTLNKSIVVASGGASGLDGKQASLDIKVSKTRLDFDDLRRCLPGASDLPRGGFFIGSLKMSGSPNDKASLNTQVTIEQLKYGQADIKGDLALKDFVQPHFHFDIESPYLDIDQLLGEGSDDETASEKTQKTSVDENPHGLSAETRKMLATVSGNGSLRLGRARFDGIDMQNFVGTLQMRSGVISFEALDFDIYGGHVSAAGTRLDLPSEYTGYKLKLKTKNLDIGQALAAHTKMGPLFAGRIKQDIDLSGRGLNANDLATSLDGPASIKTSTLSLKSLDLLGPIAAPLRSALKKSGIKGFKGFSTDKGIDLRDVYGWLQFAKGRFRLKKPVKSATKFGAVELSGGGALDGSLDMKAIVELSADTMNQSMGRKVSNKALRVPLNIGGTWRRPLVTGVDVKSLLASILSGQAGAVVQQAEQAAKQAIDNGAAQAKQQAQQARAKAEAEAKKRANALKAKAEEQKKQAEAEAKKRADAAKKLAEQKRKQAEAKARAEAERRRKAAEKAARARAKKAEQDAKNRAKNLLGL